MKKSLFFVVFTMVLSVAGLAQNGKISYQAVVRNSANQLVYDQDLDVVVGIANSETGTAVYTETHAVHSNANGLISLLIGDGAPVAGSNWDAIQWNHAWVTAVVSQGGTELATHHLPLSAVPYALYADQVDPVALANYLTANHYLTEEVQVLSISNDTIYLTGGSWVKLPAGFSGDYNDLTNKPTNVSTFNNDAGYLTKDSAVITNLQGDVTNLQGDVTTLNTNVAQLQETTRKDALCDSVEACVTGWISDSTRMVYDSLHTYYATTDALKDSLTRYVSKEKLNDTLGHYLQADVLCDSIVKCDVIRNLRDSVQNNTENITNNTTNITNITNNITNYVTNLQGADSVLAERLAADSTNLADNYYNKTDIDDTLSRYLQAGDLCDSIVKCDVIQNMRDSIRTNASDITSLQNADAALSARITADSTNLAGNYYNKTSIKDTLSHYLMHEEQMLSIGHDTIYLSGGSFVKLPAGFGGSYHDLVDTPTNVSAFTNDAGYLTSFTEQQMLSISNDTIYLTGGSFVKLPAGFSGNYNDLTNKPDLGQYATNEHLNDTLNNYYTQKQIRDTLNNYYTQTQIKDTLSHYLQAGDLCDSIVKCDVVRTMRDSIQINASNITDNIAALLNADSILAARILSDSVLFHQADSILMTRILNDSILTHNTDSILAVRILNDSILSHQADSVLFARIIADSTNLADYYYTNTQINDTLSHYLQAGDLCDSIVKCDVIQNMRDSIRTNASDITSLQNADAALSARITADSANLASNYYNKTNIKDTLSHYLMHEEQMLSIGHDTIYLSGGSFVKLPAGFGGSYHDLVDTPTNVSAFTNDAGYLTSFTEQQMLSISNDTIYLTGGSFVKLPAGFSGNYNDLTNKPDLGQYATNEHLNDTLNNYYTQEQIKDTLSHYLQAGDLCDSIVKCDIVRTLRDSIQIMFDSIGSMHDSIFVNTTNITNNTENITTITNNVNNITTDIHALDSVISARIIRDSTELSNRMDTLLTHVCDSVETCVKGWISDSTRMIVDSLGAYYDTTLMKKAIHDTADVLRSMMTDAANDAKITIQKNGGDVGHFTLNQATGQAINILVPTTVAEMTDASNYVTHTQLNDTLGAYYDTTAVRTVIHDSLGNYLTINGLCDSVKKCVVIKDMQTDITKLQTADNNLSTRIQNDSTNLKDHYYTKTQVDSATNKVRNDICDSATHCMERALANPNSAINNAVDSIAENIAGHAIHDTLVHNVKFTNKGDSLFLKRGGIVDTVKFPAGKMIQDSLEKYVRKTAVRDSVNHAVADALADGSSIINHAVDTIVLNIVNDTLQAYYDSTRVQSIIHDSIESNVHDGKLAVITHGVTKLDTIQKFTANQAGNDTLDLSRYALIDTLHDFYATKAALAESVHKIDSLAGVTMRDSANLKDHYYTQDEIDTKLHDTTKYALRTALRDTALNIRNDICDSASHCIERALKDPNSEINHVVDTIAANIAGHAIHDTLVHNVQFTNKGDSLFLRRGGIIDTVKFPAGKMIQDSLEKYVRKTVVRDSVNHAVADALADGSSIINHAVDTIVLNIVNDTLQAYYDSTRVQSIIHDSIESNVHDGKLAVITHGVTKLDTIQKFTANQAGNDTLDLSRYALIDTLHDFYATKAALAESVHKIDSLAGVTMRDSANLKDHYYTQDEIDTKLHDTTKYALRTALRDTALNIRNDICDSASHCIERALKDPNSEINHEVDTIAANIAGHAIHDTLVHNVKFTNKGDSLFLKRGGIVDTVKFPAAKMIQDSLEKYVLKTAVRDSITNNVNLTVKHDSLFLTHGNGIDTVPAGKMIHDSIANRVHDGKLAVITHGATKLDTIQKFTANQAGNDTIDLSRYALMDTLHDYYATKTALRDSMHKVDTRIKTDSLEVRGLYIEAAKTLDSLAHVTYRDSIKLKTNYYTRTQVDSTADKVRSEIGKGKLTIQYGTNPAVEFGANQDTTTTVTIPTPPEPTYGTLTIKKNNEPVGTFTANETKEININVPTCDSLAECDLIKSILARLDRLERQNDSLARELDKMKPLLTLAGPQKDTVCSGSTKSVTYTATFHNCSSSDYTLAWKVNGTDSSNVTGSKLILNVETAGQYVVVCIATRSDSTFVTDTVTTTVTVDNDVPSFTIAIEGLKVTLSDVVNTATIQWDTDSLPESFTSNTHTYSVADTISITATSERGCTFTKDTVLQPIAPAVTTDSVPSSTIAATTAKVYGTVTSDGGIPETKRGILYSTSDQNLEFGANGIDSVMNGTGKGNYACTLERLVPCTKYYVRAFAYNEVDTVYGVVKEFTTPSFTCGSTLYDIDGNDYATLLLGSQCWMKQNLRVSHYANGDTILLSTSTVGTTSPYRYEPDSNLTTYGYLYNWYAAMGGSFSSASNPSNVQGVCPDGWHLPSDAEWTQLTDFVASYDNGVYVCGNDYTSISKSMVSQQGWPEISGDGCRIGNTLSANNSTGFSIPSSGTWDCGGGVGTNGEGYTNNGHAIFLSATENDNPTYSVYCREFYYNDSIAERTAPHKTFGRSVRCVRDCAEGHTYLPTVSPVSITNTGGASVSMAANVVSDGGANVTERGVCWGTTSQPTTSSTHAASGTGTGDFAVTESLTPGTTYYVRAYATNSVGTAYGAEVTFFKPSLPTVTTTAATDVAANTATTGGEVTDDGGATVTARGVCWSTSSDPTVNGNHTTDSSGLGSFVSHLTNLSPSTDYYVRAYATNSAGTAYGEQVTISTLDTALILTSDGAATIKLCEGNSTTVVYTATPTVGNVSDYTYSWSCSGGTISDTSSISNTATITYTRPSSPNVGTNSYTVYCTANHETEPINVSTMTSTTVISGRQVLLAMCSEGPTILSKEDNDNNWGAVSSISWGDGISEKPTIRAFSHTYNSPGVYTVTITSDAYNGFCDVTRTFAMGDAVMKPCMVAVAHTNNSTYTSGLETTNSDGKVTTVADIDGNTYNVVEIGSQCWMAENLRTIQKPDGTSIDGRYDPVGGISADPYGYFYSWTAVMNDEISSNTNPSNVRGICPLGWHVPSATEWDEMLTEVGTNNAAKLATGCNWQEDMASAFYNNQKLTPGDFRYPMRNSSGFGALPAGYYNASLFGTSTRFWTSHAYDNNSSYYREIVRNVQSVSSGKEANSNGYSLRCVRDDGIAEPMSVTTGEATNIGTISATLNGSISNPSGVDITLQGFEWKATADGSYTQVSDIETTQVSDIETTLSYNLPVTSNTGYTYRTFAQTPYGIVYGDEQSFISRAEQFTVMTEPATNIAQTSAILNGSIANPDPNNITISEMGFEWKETSDVNYTPVPVSGATQNYNFTLSHNLTDLTPNRSYTIRAYAIINTGTEYGDPVTFITPSLSLTASPSDDTLVVCGGTVTPITYTATFANVNSTDYTISWNVNDVDSSTVTGTQLTVNVNAAGAYKVTCVATREGYCTLMDTIATYVNVITPSFTVTTDQLSVELSDIANTLTIKWDNDSEPEPVSGTSATHTYSAGGIYTITATSEEGCGASQNVTLSVKKYCPNVSPRSNENGYSDGIDGLRDVDGNSYTVVDIGGQCWMAENLRTTHYSNNVEIPLGQPYYDDNIGTYSPFRCYPYGNSANVSSYGYLYNWTAMLGGSSASDEVPSGVQGVCPSGWHVPSADEWDVLFSYLSSQSQFCCENDNQNIAKSLAFTAGWATPTTEPLNCKVGYNQNSNNATGFNAVPTGRFTGYAFYPDYNSFGDFGKVAYFWSTSLYNYNNSYVPYYIALSYDDSEYVEAIVNGYGQGWPFPDHAVSVRCLRD